MARRRKGRPISGILVLDKPQGLTSNAALQTVKRLLGAAKAGHTGSLDPMATGVLPLCFGEATKVANFLLEADKTYEATCRLGEASDTGDADGEIVERFDLPDLTEQDITEVMAQFTGDIEQIPPMYSALKRNGRPLYELARKGIEVEREARAVTIHELSLKAFDGKELTFSVTCSKGTYVRTLAEDLAKALGCGGGHLTMLRRTLSTPFDLSQSVTLEQMESMREAGESIDPLLQPAEDALGQFARVNLDPAQTQAMLHGQPLDGVITNAAPDALFRIFDDQKRFLGIGCINDKGQLAPKRLFNLPQSEDPERTGQ